MNKLLKAINAAVPAGYRAIDFRTPKEGEWCLSAFGTAEQVSFDFQNGVRLILEREIQWPDCIRPGTWMAKDKDDKIWLYHVEPVLSMTHSWVPSEGVDMYQLSPELMDLSWIPDLPWKESKRQKPIRKTDE